MTRLEKTRVDNSPTSTALRNGFCLMGINNSPIMSSASQSDPTSGNILRSLPFVVVDGVMNMRTVGGYPAAAYAAGTQVTPLHVFRSGDLSRITELGQTQLRALGITTVFDLRSEAEIARYGSTTPGIEGVRVVRAPAMTDAAWHAADLEALLRKYQENEIATFVEEYEDRLKTAGLAFKTIFTHLRDRPSEPCLVFDTAGKDRTGLFAAVLLLLLGASDADIVKDYALTTQGLAPYADMLAERFKAVPVFRDNWEGFLKMGSSREEPMAATLAMIRAKFGGAEGYLKTVKWCTRHRQRGSGRKSNVLHYSIAVQGELQEYTSQVRVYE
ncbi:putative tyrosine phosphatase family protein [Lyophyllum shimeji]|uniref:Tyrosine phosphatase family protein n=1 Tax=Lyophyllum shimeji TaxID=47721 RepID=A0A9P3PZQ1_LYOSH|nr:putative tyrosine phosphatase family protein [Lyophyllum shimeji]